MRKSLVFILALLYISTSVGATMHMHYCMGKLVSRGFAQNDSEYSSDCGLKESNQKNKGCCKDEKRFLKNDTDQKSLNQFFSLY